MRQMSKQFPTYGDAHAAVNDAFSAALHFCESQGELGARIAAIRAELNSQTPSGRRRYSMYERYELAGYIKARYDDIWQHVEFCYRDPSGVLFYTDRDSAHRKANEFSAAGRGSELLKLQSAYVWKGTDKNYTPWCRYDPR